MGLGTPRAESEHDMASLHSSLDKSENEVANPPNYRLDHG